MAYLEQLLQEFENNANPGNAILQKSYLKNHFDFFGIKTTERRSLQKPFLVREFLPAKKVLPKIVKALWEKPQRECQYFAQELTFRYLKAPDAGDIDLYIFMVSHKPWWDTVDFIAANLVGSYFKNYPEKREMYCAEWLQSGNRWLQRTALLFQLKYKDQLDTGLLATTIQSLLGSKEFFINKAIGWVLREYSKTDPEWVEEYLRRNNLAPLSQREAGKYLHR